MDITLLARPADLAHHMNEDTHAATETPDRQRGAARRVAFMAAAREVFLEQGYEAANVNDVVRRAGGSMATLYSQFGNKEGLFLAVAKDQLDSMVAAMTPQCVDHLPLRQGLQLMGERVIAAMLAPDNVRFFRILVGEGRKFPQLLRRYLASAADNVRDVVAGYLRRVAPSIEDPDGVATYYLDMLRSRHHYKALANEDYALGPKEIAEHVAGVVRFVLAATRLA